MIARLARAWARLRGRRHGDFMWCASGRHFWPFDPSEADYAIEDVARGLAHECRYAGQTRAFYSVAEHCVIVSQYVERVALERGWPPAAARLAAREGLLHDLDEAYVGDMIRPLKCQREMRSFRRVGSRILRCGYRAFGVCPTRETTALVDEIDRRVLVDEIAALIEGADLILQARVYGPALGCVVAALSPAQAEHVFVTRFLELFA